MPESATPLSPEALDFAPGLLAIQESPPARLPRAVMYAVTALFAILVALAFFGRLDITADANGRLIPKTHIKIVQPADGGIVEQILVKEGQTVKAGQVLMRMDATAARADAHTLQTELAAKSLQLRRIDAELAGRPMNRRRGDPPDMFRQVAAQYRDHRKSYEDQIGQAREALARARREYASGAQVLLKLREVTPILKAQAEAYAGLGKGGYAPKVQVRDKERLYLEKAQDLRAQQDTVAGLAAAEREAAQELARIGAKYRSDLQNERVTAAAQYSKLTQNWAKLAHKMGLLQLRAPRSGIVENIATHTVGTVVSPGTVLLTLVPENEPLVAEVMVKNDDVGFVYPHQKAKVKIAAYPFEEYGMLDGEVTYVGADASERNGQPSETSSNRASAGKSALSYKVLVALNSQTLAAQGKKFKLMPGMRVTVEINQGSRSVMEFLLSPVEKTLFDSGHER